MDSKEFKDVDLRVLTNKIVASNLVGPLIDLCKRGKSPEKAWAEIIKVYREILVFIENE